MESRAPNPDTLASIRAAASDAGIFCDFDGTLAPIVDDPDAARAVDGAAQALSALASTYGCVAVVSGRPVGFLIGALGEPDGVRLVGLYGIESVYEGVMTVDARVDLASLASVVEELRSLDDVWVEDKGFGAAVHLRRSADPETARARALPVLERIVARGGLTLRLGKQVLELVPDLDVDKGSATRALIESTGVRAGVAIGDDLGDVAAFDAVGELEPSLRVAVTGPECPPELLAAADATVADPAAVVELLQRLV